ncbi:MAG: hypothetical protein RLZZ367_1550 [Bacteroidota bacterium]|jgi:hypothetical protein
MKHYLLTLMVLAGYFTMANHLAGGSLSYTSLGNNQYQLSLTLYRDCNCINCADFGSWEFITIFNSSGLVYAQPAIAYPGKQYITTNYTDSCAYTPGICMEKAVYDTILTLPNAAFYTITYQRCCWGNITNLSPDQGLTLSTKLITNNNPPVFDSIIPVYARVNRPFTFPFPATNVDGDTIRYSICSVWNGADPVCVDPSPNSSPNCPTAPPPPPYTNALLTSGFSTSNPTNFPSDSGNLTIDTTTGLLSVTPNTVGRFVIGICATEYRNDTAIGETKQVFLLTVLPCNTPTAIAPIESDDILIYPNPATEFVQVKNYQQPTQITVRDLQGRLLQIITPESKTATINIQQYAKGTYVVGIHSESGSINKRLIIE